MNPNRPARLNRAVLGLLGLLILATGAFVLLVGTGFAPTVLPIRPDAPLLATIPSPPGWAPWAGAVAAIIVMLLAVRWLLAQTVRQPSRSDWQLAPDSATGTTHIDGTAAAAPLAEEISDLPGVTSASARLSGPRRQPQLQLRVTADDRADVSDLRRRIDRDAIPRLMQALDLPALPAEVLLRLGAAAGVRAR